MKRIIIKPGREGRIRAGHPWVYDNEIAKVLEGRDPDRDAPGAELIPGELADVETSRRQYLGRAFANPHSKIRARIYSPSKEGVDKGFFKHRIREAVMRRVQVDGLSGPGPRLESRRLVFAEADFLPGLIIDRFAGWPLADLEAKCAERPVTFAAAEAALGPPESWLVVQFLIYGMDERREEILDALTETLSAPLSPQEGAFGPPRGIIEKSAARVRGLEGLLPREGLIRGDFPRGGIVIFENGLPFAINPEAGQKTGHFLDQRENRLRASSCTGGGRVLDACSYTGGFAVHAARPGAASEVIAVDVSKAALETVMKNAALNGVENRITAVEADVFDYLRRAEREAEKFDLVILDPPAFAKSGSALEGALRGYREINFSAVRLVKRGGCLVTCSCSQAVGEETFKRVIASAAADAGRRLIQIDFRSQAPDHPILLGYDESFYLKCGYYRVL
ncbi:MAG: class I SAM-dependent rRNA methyltransferase [Spirochaetaceae bacterium]|jgi:23S rRNA (cytosine1962-C5)-methyltransferase|nr:class I SAM-dependent rRNA methyltransferase [Spirochaetaceae bacterium]